ncbi:hypothetical protein ZHAS_00011880 [Anopheles sinensis]|uniref:Uncharacterized protein n=1 Tax=Anopheles sinensis TaxID=74873 RepID=A0A084W1F5_ANOSI|nr:hypothetical protein ZHAS_00011880 [Anopheles sinensis]
MGLKYIDKRETIKRQFRSKLKPLIRNRRNVTCSAGRPAAAARYRSNEGQGHDSKCRHPDPPGKDKHDKSHAGE